MPEIAPRKLPRQARSRITFDAIVEAYARILRERGAHEITTNEIAERVSADRELYRALLRDAPFLQALPETRRARDAFFALARTGSERARDRLRLPEPEADTWLIGRMLSNAVLEIAFADDGTIDRELLVSELVRLTHRLLHGRDPSPRQKPARARR